MMIKYSLKWRNTTIIGVDWENHTIKFYFNNYPNSEYDFSFEEVWKYIDSSDDLQAIKMIMDRLLIITWIKEEIIAEEFEEVYCYFEYIKDIFVNPYEDIYEMNIKKYIYGGNKNE